MKKVKIQITDTLAKSDGQIDPGLPIKDKIIAVLKTVYDPELPVNLYDLGLIYAINVAEDIAITMTLTAPNCPVADQIPQDVKNAVMTVADGKDVHINLVWEPKWTKEMMSEAAKIELGFY